MYLWASRQYLPSKSTVKKTVVFTFLWTEYSNFFLEMNDEYTIHVLQIDDQDKIYFLK